MRLAEFSTARLKPLVLSKAGIYATWDYSDGRREFSSAAVCFHFETTLSYSIDELLQLDSHGSFWDIKP